MDESQLRDAIHLIWRNIPSGVSTFGPCIRECGSNGRGGGVCLICAQKDLAGMVGDELARDYVATVRIVRSLENQMVEKLP